MRNTSRSLKKSTDNEHDNFGRYQDNKAQKLNWLVNFVKFFLYIVM